jgi:hypothetical protein
VPLTKQFSSGILLNSSGDGSVKKSKQYFDSDTEKRLLLHAEKSFQYVFCVFSKITFEKQQKFKKYIKV